MAIAYDFYTDGGYVGGGAHPFNHNATGANLVALLFIWVDNSGTFSVNPTYGGNAMTLTLSHTVVNGLGGKFLIYHYIGPIAGLSAITFTYSTQSVAGCGTWTGCGQVSQPDASSYTSGVQSVGNECAGTVTTVIAGTAIVGMYASNNALSNTPSSNGTFISVMTFGAGYIWRETNPNVGSGSLSLQAKGNSAGTAYEALTVALAPIVLPSGGASNFLLMGVQ